MPVMKQLRIGSETYDTVGEASVTQVQTSGTKIATVTIDGTATDLYAPEGGSSVDPSSTTPAMDGTAAVGTSTDYARADHVHPTDTSRAAASHTHAIADVTGLQTALDGKQDALVSGTNIKTINGESLLGSGDLSVGGGGNGLLVTITETTSGTTTTATFDKTAQEIKDALDAGIMPVFYFPSTRNYFPMTSMRSANTIYKVAVNGTTYSASSASGYPSYSHGGGGDN